MEAHGHEGGAPRLSTFVGVTEVTEVTEKGAKSLTWKFIEDFYP